MRSPHMMEVEMSVPNTANNRMNLNCDKKSCTRRDHPDSKMMGGSNTRFSNRSLMEPNHSEV